MLIEVYSFIALLSVFTIFMISEMTGLTKIIIDYLAK